MESAECWFHFFVSTFCKKLYLVVFGCENMEKVVLFMPIESLTLPLHKYYKYYPHVDSSFQPKAPKC